MSSFMQNVRANLADASLYRKLYILTLLSCRIVFVQALGYAALVLMFVWGAGLMIYRQHRQSTFFKLRFGLWIGGFLGVSLLTMLVNFSFTLPVSFVMLLHVMICFFIFYGIHTEPDFDVMKELGFVAKAVVYIVTAGNLIGLFCLLFGIIGTVSFNVFFVRVDIPITVFENRFTGLYTNPNQLGFISVSALFCLHMLSKQNLRDATGKISNAWVVLAAVSNLFAVLLSDSNSAFVLLLGYLIVYLAYNFFTEKKRLSALSVVLRSGSVIAIAVVMIFSSLMFRTIFNTGFAAVTAHTNSLSEAVFRGEGIIDELGGEEEVREEITFEHENKNLDSGRFRLWNECLEELKSSPVIGVSQANIVYYSSTRFNGALRYDMHHNDPHNGLLAVLTSTGILGFAMFCIFGFRFAKHCAQHLFRKGDEYKEDVFPCIFSFLIAYVVFSLFEVSLLYSISYVTMFFWLMMGYASTYVFKKEYMLSVKPLFGSKLLKRSML